MWREGLGVLGWGAEGQEVLWGVSGGGLGCKRRATGEGSGAGEVLGGKREGLGGLGHQWRGDWGGGWARTGCWGFSGGGSGGWGTSGRGIGEGSGAGVAGGVSGGGLGGLGWGDALGNQWKGIRGAWGRRGCWGGGAPPFTASPHTTHPSSTSIRALKQHSQ